jgi:putative tryptophan/tyrosine transport system substrate-binding protein
VLGGAAACPLAALAQQAERVRRVGVLMGFEENDLEAKAFLSAFTQRLAELGWIDGRNVQFGSHSILTEGGCLRTLDSRWSSLG